MHQLRRCATGVGLRGPALLLFARVYDACDVDFAHNLADKVLILCGEFGYEAFGGCISDRCRTPGPLFPSECVIVEMMEDPFVKPSDEKGDPNLIDSPLPICVAASIALAVAMAVALVLTRRRRGRWALARAATHAKTPATAPSRAMAKTSEAVRLRLAAALLDLGNHLMLPAEERKAFGLRKRLSSGRARRLGLAAAAVRAGARRLDDVTLEIAIGESPQEGNPKRTLALSCVVYGPIDPDGVTGDAPCLFWRVANRPSPGYRGPSVTVEVPDLERALLSYHARPLRLAGGAKGGATGTRFFDEGVHDETVA